MPIFEFRCEACENEFEELCLGSAARAGTGVPCPKCGSPDTKKLLSGFQARTRGDGGETKSLSSGCSSCSATSCAGCK